MWNQDFGKKIFQNISKISKICTRKTHFSPKFPNFFFRKCRVLRIFYWELFFQVRLHVFACISCDMYAIYLSFKNSHSFQFSLWTSLTSFNSLFWEISHVSILSFDKSHTFQCEYWIACNEFLLIRSTSNLSNKELGLQMHNMFCTKFQKHKHHKLQQRPIIERSNELC